MKTKIVPSFLNRMKPCECFEGETIEEKVNRIVNNNEPITDGAPIIFTEKKDGVLPEYNPRTDRWDIALTAMEKMDRARKAKKEQGVKPEDFGKDVPNKLEGETPNENSGT
nr:MAG TPA: hypothetical protein [Microviridae sp.]